MNHLANAGSFDHVSSGMIIGGQWIGMDVQK
jgi:hypothetical protein